LLGPAALKKGPQCAGEKKGGVGGKDLSFILNIEEEKRRRPGRRELWWQREAREDKRLRMDKGTIREETIKKGKGGRKKRKGKKIEGTSCRSRR